MEERKLNRINNYQILHIEPRGSKNVVVAKKCNNHSDAAYRTLIISLYLFSINSEKYSKFVFGFRHYWYKMMPIVRK